MRVLSCFLCDSISFWLQGPWKSVFQTSENISAFKRFSLPAGCLCLADSSGCLVLFGFLNRLSDSRILFSLINDNRLQINAHHLSDLENLTAPKTVSSARTTLTIGPAVGLGEAEVSPPDDELYRCLLNSEWCGQERFGGELGQLLSSPPLLSMGSTL